jgi:hypothetical protein
MTAKLRCGGCRIALPWCWQGFLPLGLVLPLVVGPVAMLRSPVVVLVQRVPPRLPVLRRDPRCRWEDVLVAFWLEARESDGGIEVQAAGLEGLRWRVRREGCDSLVLGRGCRVGYHLLCRGDVVPCGERGPAMLRRAVVPVLVRGLCRLEVYGVTCTSTCCCANAYWTLVRRNHPEADSPGHIPQCPFPGQRDQRLRASKQC